MTRRSDPREATFYVQIERHYWKWRNGKSRNATARRITIDAPEALLPNCVAVKLTIRIPDEAFDPLQPSAVIDVPADLVQRPIEVVAGEPNEADQ